MIDLPSLRQAADDFLAAALVGDGFEDRLSQLARAAGARGAVLARASGPRTVAVLACPELAEPVSVYLRGGSPPDTRSARVRTLPDYGFRSDFCDFTASEIARDPYYQDFLRPFGLLWHGCAWLAGRLGDEITLSLKVSARRSHYEPDQLRLLDRVLPTLRTGAQVAHCIFEAEARGAALSLGAPHRLCFELDSRARVIRASGAVPGDYRGDLIVSERRLSSPRPALRARLSSAIMRAVGADRQPQLVVLPGTSPPGLLYIVPITSYARDVFGGAVALAILVAPAEDGNGRMLNGELLRSAFGLTCRQAQIAEALTRGDSLATVTTRLGIGLGTARNHLKSVFAKTGVHRQSELVRLLGRLA